jgi:sugar phosphate isomerase/epimerase
MFIHRRGQVDPAKDALVALPGCGQIHLKDVEARNDGYYFVPIGEGDVNCSMILQSIKNRPDLNLTILFLAQGSDDMSRQQTALAVNCRLMSSEFFSPFGQ